MKLLVGIILTAICLPVLAGDFSDLLADRAAIERVYYNHRLGDKPPFEKALPPDALEQLVKQDLHKEAVLKKVYGLEITPAMLDAEVQRINTTTRAPDVLAQLKAALGNDPQRFARAVARPIVVERLLRDKFENDNSLHQAARQQCEQIRNTLLTARTNGAGPAALLDQLKQANSNALSEITWQLAPRPADADAPAVDEIEIRKRFGPEARILSPHGDAAGDRKFYFDELPPVLQKVLLAQLRGPGDVSAVIETPDGFLLYLAREKSEHTLSAARLSLPKRGYEQWLAEQN
jgi:hypothetical protein